MNQSDELSKLQASESYKQFGAERELRAFFENESWEACHGAYYEDLVTGKTREVDLYASQVWTTQRDGRTGFVRLHALGEAKTMRGFHLLFSATSRPSGLLLRTDFWVGHEWQDEKPFAAAVQGSELSRRELFELREEIVDFCYPHGDQAITTEYLVGPPILPVMSSFKETNINTEKDVENSVLWRANLALLSAVRCLTDDLRASYARYLEIASMAARAGQNDEYREMLDAGLDCAMQVDLIHPFVVTDAKLWLVSDSGLAPIPMCRFVQHAFRDVPVTWCDVVNREHVREYVSTLTEHYKNAFVAAKCERKRPN